MIKDVIATGGADFLIPAVLFALLLYAVRGLFGLHGRRSQHRREFLEHWDAKRIDDDLWLEVTIRHLYGTHLPAHVIRSALAHSHTSKALLDLSALWDFFDYDPETRAVAWKHKWQRNARARSLMRHWPTLRYFMFAGVGAYAAYLATRVGGFNQWAFAILSMVMIAAAFVSLWHSEALRVAATVGEPWIKRINAEPTPHQATEDPA